MAAYGAVGAAGFAAVAAGTATFATFATVAGAAMSSLGMLTKNKALTKIGSIVGLVGGVASIASSASGAASSGVAEGTAGVVGDAVGEEAVKEGANEALKSELANSAVGETIGQTGGQAAVPTGTELSGNLGAQQLGTFGQSVAAPEASTALQLDPNTFNVAPQNLMDQVRSNWGQSGFGAVQDGFGSAATSGGVSPVLVEAGQQFKDKTAVEALLDKIGGAGRWAGDKLKGAGELIEAHPAAAKIAGNIIQGGMQMYAQNDAMNEQLNLLEQRRKRLNSPVVLGIQAPQLKTYSPGG